MVSRKSQSVKVSKCKKLKANVDENESPGEKGVTEERNSEGLEKSPRKEKLRRVRKSKKRSQSRREREKKQGMKLHALNLVLKNGSEENITDITQKVDGNSLKKFSLKELNTSSSWGIILAGIPKKWKGNLEEITDEYKDFNVQIYGIGRKNFEKEICQVIYMYFKNEEDMKNAVLFGRKEFLGKSLILRTNPVRTVYVSGISRNVPEETIRSDLKDALGPAVYDITLPRGYGQMLGYAVAYVVDDTGREEILGRLLNLWEKVQCCCSEDDFFKRFVLHILSGWDDRSPSVLEDLLETLHKINIHVCVDPSKKMVFTDESSVLEALKRSGMCVKGRKIILSRSSKVNFVMRNIPKSINESDIVDQLGGIQAFNLKFKKGRCKASFDVPAEQEKKCSDLHEEDFFGRKLQILKSDSEELKLSKEISRSKFKERVAKSEEFSKPGNELHAFAEAYRKLKKGKWNKNKCASKNGKKSKIIKGKIIRNKVK